MHSFLSSMESMELRDDEEEASSLDYCSNNRGSPEMESKSAVRHRNPAKNGLTNPRIKRRLDFDADQRSDKQFQSRDAIFRDLESVLRGVLDVKQEKDKPRKILRSADEISTPMKVFRQGKNLKLDNEVRAKRRLYLVDRGGSLSQFKKCSKVPGERQLNAQDFMEYRKRTKQSCLNHMGFGKRLTEELGNEPGCKRFRKFIGSMNEELGNGVYHPNFKKWSKSLVADLGNENISKNIEKCSKDLVKDREKNGNVEKCVRDLDKGHRNKPVGGNFEKRGKDVVKDHRNGPISDSFAKCRNDLLKGHGNEPVTKNFEKCGAVLVEGVATAPKSEKPVCLESLRVESQTDLEEMSLMIENKGPYPNFSRPSPEECRGIRDQLLDLHGFPKEFSRFRPRLNDKVVVAETARQHLLLLDQKNGAESVKVDGSNGRISCTEKHESETIHSVVPSEGQETMLDSLISTLLSQNTTEANSRRAFASLKARFLSWEEVLKADSKAVEDAIRCGGLAETKASRIRNILDTLLKERGKLSLEHLRNMPVDKIKAELYRFKGVGPKTVACILMFHLNQDDFPVDTHVFRITKSLGWVPAEANREKAYLHLNCRIPNDLKFDLNCLLITHGKRCRNCAKGERVQQAPDGLCPLLNCGCQQLSIPQSKCTL